MYYQDIQRCPPKSYPYIINEGDSLDTISQKFNVPIEKLIRFNANIDPYNLIIGQKICIPKLWEPYTNDRYNISFMYPTTWKEVSNRRCEGPNGYFEIAAISSKKNIMDVCKNEAYRKNRNYGEHCKFINLDIQKCPAVLIIPSNDQPYEMKKLSALIVQYPKPINISGKSYNYFILWSSRSYIRQIGASLNFLVY